MDGQTEVVNQTLETYLRCFHSRQPRNWPKWFAWAEYWYNTSYHNTARMSPFKVVYGREPPPLLKWIEEDSKIQEVSQMIKERNLILDELK